MSEDAPNAHGSEVTDPLAGEKADRQGTRPRFSFRSGLLLLSASIVAGLFAAPPTRALLQTQFHLRHNATLFLAALPETHGESAPASGRSSGKRTASADSDLSNAYQAGLADAMLTAVYKPESLSVSPQERYADFQKGYGERLTALQTRFPTRPGLPAHLLRYMAINTVRVAREGEVEKFQTGKTTVFRPDQTVGYAESWAAFDRTAAQGEKLDPDNAYFPMMRALGLFDAKRDAEGIAAVLRAGQKTRFDDYSLEELDAEWALYSREVGPTSMLLRERLYAEMPLPHLALLRALARLTVYKAEQVEQQGRAQEGLALRRAMMQCGLRMREQGSVLGALVGIAIVAIQTNRPGGQPVIPVAGSLTLEQRADRHRDLYLAYLHKIGAEEEARRFALLDAADRQVRTLVRTAAENHLIDNSIRPLPALWTLDMLLLNNIVAMLVLSSAVVGCANLPRGERATPAVAIAVAALCLLAVLPMQWAEALTQMRVALGNLALLSWDSAETPGKFDMAALMVRFPWTIHFGEVFFSLLAPALALLSLGAASAMRREAFAAALVRGMRRGAPVVVTLLLVVYTGTLLATLRAEARFGEVFDGVTRQGAAYLQREADRGRKP